MIFIAATIKDVARRTGLSIATISKYINGGNVLEQNKELIENAIRELGFKVNEMARGLKTSKTMTVGILIPNLEQIFSTSIVSSMEDMLLKHGYSTIICDYRENPELEKEKLNFLVNKMVDGIVMMPLNISPSCIQEVMDGKIPIILIDRILKDISTDVVLVDNLNASYDAVEQLIIKGHRRIGIICGPENIYTAQERLKGYLRVHEDYSLEVHNELVKYGDYKLENGYELLKELVSLDYPPTALYVTNYEMTMGAIIAINENNIKVPEQLSIIGFDNLEMARVVKPPLSIVVQPMKQIGETAAQILLKRLNGDLGGFPVMHRLKTEILIKNSVKQLI